VKDGGVVDGATSSFRWMAVYSSSGRRQAYDLGRDCVVEKCLSCWLPRIVRLTMTHPVAKPWRFDTPPNQAPPICSNRGKNHRLSLDTLQSPATISCCLQPNHEQFITVTESPLRHQPALHTVYRRQGSLFGMVVI
jgi:hypothetical protein